MAGHEARIRLQARDELLISALKSFRILSRPQAAELAGFSSVPRANARLLALTRAGFLSRSFIGSVGQGYRAIYRLPGVRSKWRGSAVFHQLAVNEIHLAFLRCSEIEPLHWTAFSRPLSPFIPLVPDGYAELRLSSAVYPIFIEADLGTEAGRIWKAKADRYLRLALSGEFERLSGRSRFRVAVVAHSERRATSIAAAVHGVTDKLFFISTFSNIKGDGLLKSTWLRPDGSRSLLLP